MNLYDKANLIITPNAYKASKIYATKPVDGSGDLTFSRASTAMRRNAAGLWESVSNNIPRLHYPVGGGCPAWLLEPQRTNELLHSDNFSQSAWNKNLVTVTPDQVQSPIVGVMADEILFTASTGFFTQAMSTINGASKTVSASFFIKNKDFLTNETIKLRIANGVVEPYNFIEINYKPFNNTYTTTAGASWTNTSFDVKDEGNGWYRVILVGTTAQWTSGWAEVSGASATRSLYISNIQIELGTYATSPIITTSAAVTRVADFGSKNFGTYSEGTLFYDDIPLAMVNYGGPIMLSALSNSTASCIALIDYANGNTELYTARAGVSASGVIGPDTKNTRRKYCIVFSQTRIDVYKNGNTTPVLSITDATKIPASISFYNINYNVGGALEMSYLVNTLLFSPTLFTAAEAAAITAL